MFGRNEFQKQLEVDAALLGVPKSERIMATALGPKAYEPPVVIATDKALYFATNAEPSRIEWPEIAKATWEDPWLEVTTNQNVLIKLHLDPCGDVPPTVRDRVTASVLFREKLELDTGGSITAVGRREPESTAISWLIEFHGDLDPSDPLTAASADRALGELRNTLGV
jgi:hypothetical protein